MRSLRDIWRFAFSPPAPTLPPSPDELAKSFAAALMTTGAYADERAAIKAAWWAVPAFYQGRHEYVTKIAPLYFLATENPAFGKDETSIGETAFQA